MLSAQRILTGPAYRVREIREVNGTSSGGDGARYVPGFFYANSWTRKGIAVGAFMGMLACRYPEPEITHHIGSLRFDWTGDDDAKSNW